MRKAQLVPSYPAIGSVQAGVPHLAQNGWVSTECSQDAYSLHCKALGPPQLWHSAETNP